MSELSDDGIFLFKSAIEAKTSNTIREGAFLNAIHEYVFRLPRENRGLVDRVVMYNTIREDKIVATRCARVHVIKEGKKYYFWIFAEAWTNDHMEWKIIARSRYIEGTRIRQPNYQYEVTCFEDDEDD